MTPASSGQVVSGEKTIYIVEDDRTSALIISNKLGQRGYRTRVFHSPREFLSVLSSSSSIDDISLILLDLMMPEMSGLEVLTDLRKRWSSAELPVIVLTSSSVEENVVQALLAGANDYLTKGVSIEITVARIQSQIMVRQLHHSQLQQSRLEAIGSLVVTYQHQLNSPLTVALGCLELLSGVDRGPDTETIQRLSRSVEKMATIVKKIDDAVRGDIQYEAYGEKTKTIKVS